jgi:hypothetical protein
MSAPAVAQDVIATETIAGAGALTFWTLSGELDVDGARVAFEHAGLDPERVPQPPTPSVALARASAELRAKNYLVRPLGKGGGFAAVRESSHDDNLDYNVELRVKLNAIGAVTFEPTTHPRAGLVRAAYARHLDVASSEDVGAWLCREIRRVDGVPLRESGGFYFVPPRMLDRWNKIGDALRSCSAHRLFTIPAMRTSSAVEAILAAVEGEAQSEADRIEESFVAGDLGERALGGRVDKVDAIAAKVERYEELLGTKLDSLRDRLMTLRAGLAAAALKGSGLDELAGPR